MTAAFIFVSVLLVLGIALRLRVPLFRALYIPASVIAGGLGLLFVQFSGNSLAPVVGRWTAPLQDWPGWLIAVVFAGMLLERKAAPWRESLSRVGRQGLMVWVIVLGQTAVGLLITWLLIQPFMGVPNSLGMLIETGFAGGHGTAAAMGQVFAHPTIGLEGGLDLGILMATCGLVYGIVSGIVWINMAVRRGWVEQAATTANDDRGTSSLGVPIGYARVSSETIDPLLLQVTWLALAFGVGVGLQSLVGQLAGWSEQWFTAATSSADASPALSGRLTFRGVVDSFPLFIYTLFGGLFLRQLLRWLGLDHAVDRDTINRLSSTAMDLLVVSAITTLNLSAVATLLVPFGLLLVGGAVWSGLCLLVISRWLLPRQHWFQLGLINYGMSTGTTATGFVLLRLVDPELESGAAEDYALAAPLSSPFIGGGMITVGLPLLVLENVPIAASALALSGLVGVLILIGHQWNMRAGHQPGSH